jgi:enterochelin esterase-like enzyme
VRFCLEAGTWEEKSLLITTRLLHSILIGKGYAVSYHESPAGHAPFYWQETLPDALISAVGITASRR